MNPESRFDPSRRTFLGWSALAAAAALAPRALARAAAPKAAGERVLVLLELAGGNDGLNTLVPFRADPYAAARGGLAIPAGEVLKLSDDVGLHPRLGGLRELYDAGQLAVVQGIGYPDPVRSHFLSMDIWHAGDVAGRRVGTGWLGRLADERYAEAGDPNALIAIGSRVPFCCEGERVRAIALKEPGRYKLYGSERSVKALDSAVSSADVSDRARAFLAKAYRDARASSDAVQQAARDFKPAVDYPQAGLAGDLKTVAALLSGGLGARLVHVQMGGFDTHSGQTQRHQKLMQDLGDSLLAFWRDLAAHGQQDRVLVVAYSEFGRRVAANGSGGTDHGAASVAFVLGQQAKGGLHGAYPDLDRLDDNGDLVATTDFRSLYAAVIERWLGAGAEAVLGESFVPLDVL